MPCLLAEAITQESTVSLGLLLSVAGLVFSAAIMAIVAAVTTKVSNQKDIAALLKSEGKLEKRIAAIEAWQGKTQTGLALVRDRQDRQARSAGTGTYPSLEENEE
jgi:hypothetical protein